MGRCLAACKLVLPGSASQETFEHTFELLCVLVENFLAGEARIFGRPDAEGARDNGRSIGATWITGPHVRRRATNVHVCEAIDQVDQRFCEPSLTVGSIAESLGMNSSYLAHLFVQQTGVRLSRYIAWRRLQRAAELLEDTRWQVKRIAFETGHVNSDWFGQAFRSHTGMTPGEFRRKARLGWPVPDHDPAPHHSPDAG
jgi:AraC-like DNA-binding protein